MKLKEIVKFLDEYLKVGDFQDDSWNGLQVEGPEEVERIATAVDASFKTFERAREWGTQLLLVHHGLFWGKPFPLVGVDFSRIEALIKNGMGLYACHLPLDAHPEVGNNAVLSRMLNLKNVEPFGYYKGTQIGCAGVLPQPLTLEEIKKILEDKLNQKVQVWGFGKKEIRSVAIVSGEAGSIMKEGLGKYDLLLTGGTGLSLFRLVEDASQSIIFAGHYATETVGIKAVGELLSSRFSLKHTFLDVPSPY
ncbi:MAG: Nif3-like dinuclear metal center hexameric protein [Caldiserica bacterium]|jgi:dinuclear metal center YbgI/SA1388 family protein|nr:Nif3-like dinuclear metal center hexameric protein [Caldisericota bacterium]